MQNNYFLQQIVNGLCLGSVYALVAIGYSIVYGILRLINFAHGDIMMIGVYVAFFLMSLGSVPIWVSLLLAMAFSALVGVLVEHVAYRPLRSSSEESTMMTSLAVSILIENLAVMTLTAQPRPFKLPDFMNYVHKAGPVSFTNMNLTILFITAFFLILLLFFVKRTNLGTAMRACADNLSAARLMGINVNVVISASFIIGSVLAAVAGFMLAGQYGTIDPLMGFVPGLKAFIAAVIGGIGSLAGAALGGYVLGLAEVLIVGLLPAEFSPYRDAFVFLLLILVLLVKPNGLLGAGNKEESK